ncbi:hypothetical protein HYFRA_00009480 [Hymenoscyphus fraxineus]|uniref:Uncharacterized protein n=1 Tax=Hymenoscyphus fraxineus TaxID=746836 RepID=A0A9N9L1V4_9HELO|nr:hypothetical protein HYFRA_00009480 [Hymenoscyphus fraxineus]
MESRASGHYRDVKMQLDTGCQIHDLIPFEVVADLQLEKQITFNREEICLCLNGEHLSSIGTIEIRWKGKGFRKIFHTKFHVIEGTFLPWQVILGAETIDRHGILKFGGFAGGRSFLNKEKEGKYSWDHEIEDKANRPAREEEHRKKCEKNDAKKAAHKKKKDGDNDAGKRKESSSNGY